MVILSAAKNLVCRKKNAGFFAAVSSDGYSSPNR